MKASTAEEFRKRFIVVTASGVPGVTPDLHICCRRPDPLALIAQGALPLGQFAEVLTQLNESVSANVIYDNRPLAAAVADDPVAYLRFVDVWACAAAVSPRLVLTEQESLDDPAALWVSDLDQEVRIDIARKTNRTLGGERLKTAVADFRRQQSAGAGAGSDGPSVRDETVGVAADA